MQLQVPYSLKLSQTSTLFASANRNINCRSLDSRNLYINNRPYSEIDWVTAPYSSIQNLRVKRRDETQNNDTIYVRSFHR